MKKLEWIFVISFVLGIIVSVYMIMTGNIISHFIGIVFAILFIVVGSVIGEILIKRDVKQEQGDGGSE